MQLLKLYLIYIKKLLKIKKINKITKKLSKKCSQNIFFMIKSIMSFEKNGFLANGRIAKWPNAADCKSVPSGSMVQIHLLPPFQILPRSQVARHQTLTLTFRWFESIRGSHFNCVLLAQSVEHLTFNQRVWSSNLQQDTKLVYCLR